MMIHEPLVTSDNNIWQCFCFNPLVSTLGYVEWIQTLDLSIPNPTTLNYKSNVDPILIKANTLSSKHNITTTTNYISNPLQTTHPSPIQTQS
jgi:hypothetical protein